jgi:photosystem II protein PsbQ
MLRFRSLLSLILVLVTTLLVSCGGPSATIAPPTYTAEKIEQLQSLAAPIEVAREKMSDLQSLIEKENWVDTVTFIHGPLGLLRQQMSYLSGSLLPKDQPKAQQLAKEVFRHFEQLDVAAKARNYGEVVSQYREALKDFDAFLSLIPKAS